MLKIVSLTHSYVHLESLRCFILLTFLLEYLQKAYGQG